MSRIHNLKKASQPIDFSGLNLNGRIYPTDIDGLIEINNEEYIIFEVKYRDSEVPFGQRLALERMTDDFRKAGKRAVAIVCEHNVKNYEIPVKAADCPVREMYFGLDAVWKQIHKKITLKEAIDLFEKRKGTESEH